MELVLLVARSSPVKQHVVLVKNIHGNTLEIYDSNEPAARQKIFYSNGRFVSPGMNFSDGKPLSLFLFNEDEMDFIQQANYTYYKNLCNSRAKK